MSSLKPNQIVQELDKYIIGQHRAKRSVAIALRNRWRRQQVPEDLRDEIVPKNIILIGPTGVGKTEIARRLSNLTDSPFTKVEASKFTEVGYVGRDVESMVRDLLELTVNVLKSKEQEDVKEKGWQIAEERMLDLLLPKGGVQPTRKREDSKETQFELVTSKSDESSPTREKLRKMLRQGKLDNRYVDLDVSERTMPMVEIFSNVGMEEMGINFKDMIGGFLPKSTKRRKVKVPEAMEMLAAEEAQNLVDMDKVVKEAIIKVEQSGIIFLDEIDKIREEFNMTKQYEMVSLLIALIPTANVHTGDVINADVTASGESQVVVKGNENKNASYDAPASKKSWIKWINSPATIAAFIGFLCAEIGTYYYPVTYNHLISVGIAGLAFIIVAIFNKE